jgi:hypothetical protein
MSADPFLDAHLLPAIFAAADEPGPIVDAEDLYQGQVYGYVKAVNPFLPN